MKGRVSNYFQLSKFQYLKFLILLLLFIFIHSTQALVTVTATVDRNKMYMGDTFTYKIAVSVSSSDSMAMGQPKLPSVLNKFDILNSWVGSESQSTFINGDFQVKNTKNFNFILAPQKEGELELGRASVRVNGKVYKTNPIIISVQNSSQKKPGNLAQGQGGRQQRAQQQRGRRGAFPDDDIFSQLLKRHGFPDPFAQRRGVRDSEPINPDEAFFIKVEVDKAEVFVGEQVKATWYLYTRGNVRDIDTLKYPSLNGFWKEDIEVATRLNFTREIINGVRYNKALLASYALFPLNPGPNIIDEYKARCGIMFPSLGFGKTVKSVKESQELTIQVKPLPLDKPETFSGAVGSFGVSSTLDVNVIEAHQPLTLDIRFEGRGNAKLIKLPTLPLPDGLELYDKNSEAKFYKNGKSFKNFKVLLIPRVEGDLVIPSFQFTAFDPNSEKYYEIKTKEFKVFVKKGKPQKQVVAADPEKVKEQLKTEPDYIPQLQLDWYASSVFQKINISFFWWLLIYFGILLLAVYYYLREMGLTQRKKTIQKLIQGKFKRIENLSKDKNKWRDVGAELTNMMYLSLGAVTDSGGSGLEFDKLLENAPPSIKRELADEMKKQMKNCETLSFAPDAVVGELKNNVKNQVKEINNLVTKIIDLGIGSDAD